MNNSTPPNIKKTFQTPPSKHKKKLANFASFYTYILQSKNQKHPSSPSLAYQNTAPPPQTLVRLLGTTSKSEMQLPAFFSLHL